MTTNNMGENVEEESSDVYIRGRDVFERMNYLYQLIDYWSPTNPELAAYYSELMISISKKSVLRLDTSIKRSICKGCNFHLVEGSTVRTRYTQKHGGQIIRICNKCGVEKRFPARKIKKKPRKTAKNKT